MIRLVAFLCCLEWAVPSLVVAQTPDDDASWPQERYWSATSQELAAWALGHVPADLLDHRHTGGYVLRHGIVFRMRPQAIGNVCRLQSVLVPTFQPEGRAGMSAEWYAATQRVRVSGEPMPFPDSYRWASDGCEPWQPDETGFRAPGEREAQNAVETFTGIVSAVRSGVAVVRCGESLPDCEPILSGLTAVDLRSVEDCPEHRCRRFHSHFGPNRWDRMIVNVARTDPLTIEAQRVPPPIQQ